MKITHIASECAPFAKSGGLGDVVYGLSRRLTQLKHPCQMIIPDYPSVENRVEKQLYDRFPVTFNGDTFDVIVSKATFHDLTIFLIDSTHSQNLFKRKDIYGEADDTHRFLCFSYFALSFLDRHLEIAGDILHLHDWVTGFCSCFLKWKFPALRSHIKGTLLCIHNLQHQGITKKDHLSYFKIPLDEIPAAYLQDSDPSYLNIAKAAIIEASTCVTVSPSYLKEIQTPAFGFGLHTLIQQHHAKFHAVLNGIDTDFWNPEKDLHLHRNWRPHALLDEIQEAKYRNKHFLQKKLNLTLSHEPLFIFISRLVDQKGPHLMVEALKHIEKNGGQAVLLGSEPQAHLKPLFEPLLKSSNLHINFTFQEHLSHLCFAAADFIVIPSIFEPCGLTQMISMRYGTVPIVRKTGGLSDTVFDIDHSPKPIDERNGLVFEYPTLDSMDYIINRAFNLFKNEKETWNRVMKSCLSYDFSFKKAADQYLAIYRSI